ncbi:MAG: polysaccharide pyruvyl transferase family protein [Thiotrichales bacterium]|nr:polysaccharide pyruvyl transferase family protein [Thiotrichales bacterium]
MTHYPTEHQKIMEQLKEEHSPILTLINSAPIQYLDIPVHGNVGDLLIMEGTLSFFKKNKIKLKNTFTVYNVNKKLIAKKDVLVFHGGGNLGDLYDLHQKHREDFISKFKQNRIILLPQTIYFESDANYEKTCKLFSDHKDLHICVRDKLSYELALKMTKNVYLMPDMAHQLYPLKKNDLSNTVQRTLFISRLDKEAPTEAINIKFDTKTDWDIFLERHQTKVQNQRKLQKTLRHYRLNIITSKLTTSWWLKLSFELIDESIRLFKKHNLVITNRLHGHILACLLDIPNLVLDNSYGKNASYVNVWTHKSPLVELH